ncbi:sulfotransferase family protein [Limimaricola sp.]|uniref:sulfotransferase family protein n=1 Tax=Limimaricola sp. TaxID=2211665 RepID=UPI004059D0F4
MIPAPRPLPDFVVIGAMKAGTTTLYRYLHEHPQVGMSRMKETDYFIRNKNFRLGQEWYRAQFAPGFDVYGEASPNYTMREIFTGVAGNLAEAAPEARLIFIARDPVDRFVSQYRHLWLLGHARLAPEGLLDTTEGREILATSCYAWQLQPFLERFDRAQLLILDFDELRRDPQGLLDRVTDHIGIARHPVPPLSAQNDAASIARMPGAVQRLWRNPAMRRLDPLISRRTRDAARRALSIGPKRHVPDLPEELLEAVAAAVAEDAAAFRRLSGLDFAHWRV